MSDVFITPSLREYLNRGLKESEKKRKSLIITIILVLIGSFGLSILSSIFISSIFLIFIDPTAEPNFLLDFSIVFLSYPLLLLFFYLYYKLAHKQSLNIIISKEDLKRQKEFWICVGIGGLFPTLSIIIGAMLGTFKIISLQFTSEMTISLIVYAIVAFFGYFILSTIEEILFWGYYLQEFNKHSTLSLGITLNCVFFALIHLFSADFNLLWMVNLVLFGLFANLLIRKTGSLMSAAGFHFGWNWFQNVFWGAINSGKSLGPGYGFMNLALKGPDYLTGGIWGIEANLFITMMLIIGCVFLLILKPGKNNN